MSADVFALPDLGEGLSEAEVVRWLVAAGDAVVVDQPIVEVETAKSLVELPSPFAGTVGELHGAEGDVVPVGAALMTMAGAEPEERGGSGHVLIGYGTSAPEASRGGRRGRRGRAEAQATVVEEVTVVEEAAAVDAPARALLVSSPLVRALARRRGLDLAAVEGSGPDGLITRSDVEAASAAPDPASAGTDVHAPATPPPSTATPSAGTDVHAPATPPSKNGAAAQEPGREHPEPAASGTSVGAPPTAPRTSVGVADGEKDAGTDRRTGLPELRRVPVRGVRRAISEAMTRSRTEIPEATAWVDVDATALLELRGALARDGERGPGLLALVARFVVAGLARFPELNARLDTGAGEVVLLDGVNLGIAVQAERGLLVPAVRGAHRLSARNLDAEIRRLVDAARSGAASPAELGGGSFTLNNHGVMGLDGSAAIINHPEVAILSMGRVLPRPWVVGGAVVPRSITQLSLAFDHRVCDGGTAGGFLRFVADAVEDPGGAIADL